MKAQLLSLFYLFLQSWALGLFAYMIGRYAGRTKISMPNKTALFLIFVQTLVITFIAKLIFGAAGHTLQWADSAQSGTAEFLLPLVVGAYCTRQLILMKAQGVKYTATRQYEFFLVVIILIFFGSASSTIANKKRSSPGVIVISAREQAGDFTQQHMNYEFLEKYELYTIDEIKKKIDNHYKFRAQSTQNTRLKAESHFIESGGYRFALTRVFSKDMNGANIVGIKDNELITILCIVDGVMHVEVTTGECGRKIEEIFEIDFTKKVSHNYKSSLKVTVTRARNNKGITEDDITPEWVEKIEKISISALRGSFKKSEKAADFTSESGLFVSNNNKLGVVYIAGPGYSAAVINGLDPVNGNAITISCDEKTNNKISVTKGECGRVIAEVFHPYRKSQKTKAVTSVLPDEQEGVSVIRNSSYKITEKQLTEKFLSALEANYLADMNDFIRRNEKPMRLKSESTYINKNGYKLGIVQISGGPDRFFYIQGVDKENGELVLITCSNNTNSTDLQSVLEGKCGRRISKEFPPIAQ